MAGPFDCIIIGGGLGGLTAGAALAKYGKTVLLLEQHYIPGGCATTFKRRDYVMEVGLHEIDGLYEQDGKQAIFEFLGVDKHVTFVQAPELFRYKSSSTDVVHPHGKQQTAEALIARYPAEEKGIRKYLDTMEAILLEIPRFPSARWKQLLLYPVLPLLYPNIVKVAKTSLGDFLDKHIDNTELKLILQGNLVYYHDDPYTMSMVYFSAAQASYIGGGGHFVQGGSQQLSNYLASVIENHGGQVLLGKKASRILIEDGHACGVTFTDSFNERQGETSVRAARVIANAAVPLLVDMLPPAQAKKLAKRIKSYDSACSLISLYIGFTTPPKELGCQHYSTVLVGDDVQSMADINANCHADWSQRNLIFVDYSQLDSQLAPEGKAVGAVCAADYLTDWEHLDDQAYADKKEQVAQIFISRLERLIPGIANHIEHYELGTPRTIKSYLLTPDGTPYGYAQTPRQSGMGRIPAKSPIKNLSFAGAWSFPGGGFTGAIIGGYLSGEQVYRSLAKVPPAQPQKIADSRYVRLLEKREIATDTFELVFEKPADFDYVAGQYVILEIDQPQYQALDMPIRPLSLASHPDEEVVRLALRGGHSSFKKSVDALQAGDRCRLFGPIGDFTVSARKRGIVFLVSGIGITPILPLLKELEKQRFSQPVFLFYSNRTEQAAAYHRQLQAIDLPIYEYVPVVTSTEPRINAASLAAKLTSLTAFDYYLVGHHEFLESMQALLRDSQVARRQIMMDDFG